MPARTRCGGVCPRFHSVGVGLCVILPPVSLHMTEKIQRSALYMPASNERAVQKGPALDADVIILDLEDSVSPAAKADARALARHAFQNYDYGPRQRVLRVNAIETEWFADDMALVKELQPDAVLLPKVEQAETIFTVDSELAGVDTDNRIGIWAMLETTKAVLNAPAIASVRQRCSRLSTFCIGNNDLAKEAGMRVQSDRTLLLPWLLNLVLAAKSEQLQILDGVFNDFKDTDGFIRECEQGADMGMSGKTLIHPSQIAAANTAFSPTNEDIDNARKIVHAFSQAQNADAGVVQINGKMVERLHLHMAERTLAIAEHIAQLNSSL